jgi:hypothetical protein
MEQLSPVKARATAHVKSQDIKNLAARLEWLNKNEEDHLFRSPESLLHGSMNCKCWMLGLAKAQVEVQTEGR